MRVGRRRNLNRPNLHAAVGHLQLDDGVRERNTLHEHTKPDGLGLPPAFPIRGHGTAGTGAHITRRGKEPAELGLQADATDPPTGTTFTGGVRQHRLKHVMVMAERTEIARPRPVALTGIIILAVSSPASLAASNGVTASTRQKEHLIAPITTSNQRVVDEPAALERSHGPRGGKGMTIETDLNESPTRNDAVRTEHLQDRILAVCATLAGGITALLTATSVVPATNIGEASDRMLPKGFRDRRTGGPGTTGLGKRQTPRTNVRDNRTGATAGTVAGIAKRTGHSRKR